MVQVYSNINFPFLDRLEKVHLDDIFTDNNFMVDIIKSRSDNIIEAWKEIANAIMICPIAKRKLKCLSLPGKIHLIKDGAIN